MAVGEGAAAAAAGVENVDGGGGVRHVGGDLTAAVAAAAGVAGETGLEAATGQIHLGDGDGVDGEGVTGEGGNGGGDEEGDSPRGGRPWQVGYCFVRSVGRQGCK